MILRSALLLMLGCCAAFADWTATWTTPQPMARLQLVRPPAPPTAAPARPPAAPAGPGRQGGDPALRAIATTGFKNQTVRMMVRSSLGGSKVRIKLENSFGSPTVTIGAAHIALRGSGATGIMMDSDKALTFSGRSTVQLGPGVILYSDPVDLKVPKLSDIAVTLFFPEETGPPASHNGLRTSYVSKEGDFTDKAEIPDAIVASSYYFLAGVDVMTSQPSPVLVTLGDSITEGARSTPDTNHPWPVLLAARLAANKGTANMGVANMGIGGNRLLRDNSGVSALGRLDRDVFGQSGVKWMTIMEGINDIGRGAISSVELVTGDDLIAGYKQIIERAHAMGIKVIGCTLTPFEGAGYYSEKGEVARETANNWIRTSGAFDGVADFDAVVRDTQNPKRIRADFDPGDHLHPNDAGYQAMADSFDLGIFTKKH